MSDTLIIWGVGLALTLVVGLPFVLHARRRERTTDEWEARALELGLNEPVTLHPLIDPTRCIGTGSCVVICPEVDVIGFRDGQALAVSPAKCIGHGLCELSLSGYFGAPNPSTRSTLLARVLGVTMGGAGAPGSCREVFRHLSTGR